MGRYWFSVVTLACFVACGGRSVSVEGGEAGDGGLGGTGGSSGTGGGATGGSATGGTSTGGATGGSSTGGVGGSVITGGVGGSLTGGVGGSVSTGGVGGMGASGGIGGTGNVCPTGYSLCGNECFDTNRDARACGGCGLVCPPDSYCNQGWCEVPCPPDLLECGSGCVDIWSDPSHCGGCDNVCPAGAQCINGACDVTCGGNLTNCGGFCADLRFDPYNCGGCGYACDRPANATVACETGACRYFCEYPFADCNGSGFDGCEITYASDPQNCGSCGKQCADGQVCEQMQCVGTMATFHWKLITDTACNAWCGQAPDPLDTCGGPFLCNSLSVGGYVWIYQGGPMPPPNPASQSAYGWAHWFCDANSCEGPGPQEGSCFGELAENAIYQCVYE